jgi:hypothetical protein
VAARRARTWVVWLPAWSTIRRQLNPQHGLHRLACQADLTQSEAGTQARIARHFDILPRGLPVAALTRQRDAGDALGQGWLRADPAHVRPDMASARLVACGDEMHVSAAEAEALLKPLKPVFGDAGFPISAPSPSRWYLSLPRDAQLPRFSEPAQVYGDDLLAHLPDAAIGARWRALLNEAQVILHNHPVNAQRQRTGKLSVNSLWFWGAGRLPDHVRSVLDGVISPDPLLAALAKQAEISFGTNAAPQPLPATAGLASMEAAWDQDWLARLGIETSTRVLLDLGHVQSLAEADAHGFNDLVHGLGAKRLDALLIDTADGVQLHWRNPHRWRFWRSRLPA